VRQSILGHPACFARKKKEKEGEGGGDAGSIFHHLRTKLKKRGGEKEGGKLLECLRLRTTCTGCRGEKKERETASTLPS